MFPFNISDIGSVIRSFPEQDAKQLMLARQFRLIQMTKKITQMTEPARKLCMQARKLCRTVPARKLCMHASLALNAPRRGTEIYVGFVQVN
jgi:hypothetical protein